MGTTSFHTKIREALFPHFRVHATYHATLILFDIITQDSIC
jgi:hypothetical protein